MPLSADSLEFRYTNNASHTTNTLSLGGSISSNEITNNIVFDDVTADESQTGKTEYRAIGLINLDPDYDYLDVKVWISGYDRASTKPDTISFALEKPSGGNGAIQGPLASETTAPNENSFVVDTGATVSWTTEDSGSTLTYGTIDHGGDMWMGIWLRREVPAGAEAYSDRTCTITVRGETSGSPLEILEKTLIVKWTKDAFSVVEKA